MGIGNNGFVEASPVKTGVGSAASRTDGAGTPGRWDGPAGGGQDARFERMVMPHLSSAYNLARWLVGNEHDAEDVVQESYLRAYRAIASMQGDDARAWLLAIVRNACFTLQKRNRRRGAIPFDDRRHDPADEAPGPGDTVLAESEAARIRRAMDELPEEFREAIVLRAVEGLSYKEIAQVVGVPVGTVMSRLARARGRLEQCLGDPRKREAGHEV